MGFKFYESLPPSHRFSLEKRPLVKILGSGNIYLNHATVEKWLKTKEYVKLGYDEEKNLIALKPQDSSIGAYKLTPTGKNNMYMQCPTFFVTMGVKSIKKQVFDSHWDEKEKLIIIDLNKPL